MEETVYYLVKLLFSVIVPGLFTHKMYLKIDVPIKLLRNLNLPKLHCEFKKKKKIGCQ